MKFALNKSEKLNKGVATLGWVSFLTDVASDMIYPLLPEFVTRTLAGGPAALGVIEGVAESAASLAKVASGWWSDRISRRKPIVVAGYAVAAIARPLIGLATSWLHVLAIRFSDRIGKGIRTPPRDALLAGLVPAANRARAYGLQRAMDNAGAFVGPLLAALLLRFWIHDQRTVFLLAFVPGVLAVVLLVVRVPESSRPAAEAPAPTRGRGRLPRSLWIAVAVFCLFTLANSSDAFLILRARDVGIPLWELPLLWAFLQGVKAATGVPGGILADRIGRTSAIGLGWLVYCLAYAGFAFASSPLHAWGIFALYGCFFGLTEGAERALVADIVSDEMRGRAFGLFHAAVGISALPASVLFGLWWKLFGPQTAFLIGAGLALAAAALLFALRGRINPKSSSNP